MIGRSLISAIASITCWLNSFGTVLTPMMPVGFSASTASTKTCDRRVVLRERLLEVGEIGAATSPSAR